jgi:uncharacterized membrane protein
MNRYLAVGLATVAGAAVLEAALIPGIVIGGAAVLVPKYLPRMRRLLSQSGGQASRSRAELPATAPDQPIVASDRLAVKRSIAKTITFRIIVTSLDFTSNYLVIGELATAAGLSTFALVAGPLFYFAHETAWNYFGSAAPDVNLTVPSTQPDVEVGRQGFTISRPLAKTITFRTAATTMDFTTNYVVTGNVATAAILSAFGFVVGPFIYIWHEKAWDYYLPARRPIHEQVRMGHEPELLLSP